MQAGLFLCFMLLRLLVNARSESENGSSPLSTSTVSTPGGMFYTNTVLRYVGVFQDAHFCPSLPALHYVPTSATFINHC